jgi:hypothetical protein
MKQNIAKTVKDKCYDHIKLQVPEILWMQTWRGLADATMFFHILREMLDQREH